MRRWIRSLRRKNPESRNKKGNDSYQNLLLLSLQGLAIVSSEDMMSVVALVKEYSLNAKVITKVNKLRATAGLPLLAAK